MTRSIRANDFVLVHIPESPQPPTRMRLSEVRGALLARRLPDAAVVQLGAGEWKPAATVVADCTDFAPTRAQLVIGVLAVMPLILAVIHGVAFGYFTIWPLIVLVALGCIGAWIVAGRNDLRTRTPRRLLPVLGILVALIVVAEVFALRGGLEARAMQTKIALALVSKDACATEAISNREFAEYGDPDKEVTFRAQVRDCSALRTQQRCTRVSQALKDGKPVAEGDAGSVDQQALVSRITAGQLTSDDLHADVPQECRSELTGALARKLATVPAVWGSAPLTIAPTILEALKETSLSDESKTALGKAAEASAKSVQWKSTTDDLEPGHAMCSTAASLQVVLGPACTIVEKKYGAAEAAEKNRTSKATDADKARQTSAFLACTRSCNVGRTADQAAVDNAIAQDCNQRCPNGGTCLSDCLAANPPSNGKCLADCATKFPAAVPTAF